MSGSTVIIVGGGGDDDGDGLAAGKSPPTDKLKITVPQTLTTSQKNAIVAAVLVSRLANARLD